MKCFKEISTSYNRLVLKYDKTAGYTVLVGAVVTALFVVASIYEIVKEIK